jgi:hypothetical protein
MDKEFLGFLGRAFLLLHPPAPSSSAGASRKKPETKRGKKQGKQAVTAPDKQV